MEAREGDLVQTMDNVIFDVKGLVHPPGKIIAFPRYIPSATGTRKNKRGLYGKVYNLAERFRYLQTNKPNLIVHDPVFDEELCEVPEDLITRCYKPAGGLRRLRFSDKLTDLESKALQLAESLKEASGVPWNRIGISGSILARLCTPESDIDPVVYGIDDSRETYAALEKLLKTDGSSFRAYTIEELHTLFDFRSKDTLMSFEDFVRVESRKAFQGKYCGTDFFVRFVKHQHEIKEKYGDLCYKNCGYARIKATIDDDSEAIFTPCTYKLESSKIAEGPAKLGPISQIVSLRGRFCVQARKGETVVAQGKVEHVTGIKAEKEYYQIILGNNPSDYMILSHS